MLPLHEVVQNIHLKIKAAWCVCVCVCVSVCLSVCHEFYNLNLEDFEAPHWSAAGGWPAAAFLLVERPPAISNVIKLL